MTLTLHIYQNPNNSNRVRLQAHGSLNLPAAQGGAANNPCSGYGGIYFSVSRLCVGSAGNTLTYSAIAVANTSNFIDYQPALFLTGLSSSVVSSSAPYVFLNAWPNYPDTPTPVFHISPSYVSGTPICSWTDFSGNFAALWGFTPTGTLGTWAVGSGDFTDFITVEFSTPPPTCQANPPARLTFYIFQNPNNSNRVRLQAQGSLNLPVAQGGATANPSASYGTIDVDASIISAGTFVNTLSYGITPVANTGNFLNYNPSALVLDGIWASPSTAVSPHVGMYCSAAYSPVQSERFFIAPSYVSGTQICSYSDFSGTFAQLGFGTTTGTLGTWQITGTNNFIEVKFGPPPPTSGLTFYIFENPSNSSKVRLQAQGSLILGSGQGSALASPADPNGGINFFGPDKLVAAGSRVSTLAYPITPAVNTSNFTSYQPPLDLGGLFSSENSPSSPHVAMTAQETDPDTFQPLPPKLYISPSYVSGTPICSYSDFSGTFSQLFFGSTTGTLGTWLLIGVKADGSTVSNFIEIKFGFTPPCGASQPSPPPIPPTPFVPPAAPTLPGLFLPQTAAPPGGCKEEARPYVTFSSARSVDHASVHDPYSLGRGGSFSLLLGGMIGAEYGTQTLFFSFEILQPARIGLRKANHDRPYIDQYVDLHLSGPDGLIPLGSDNFANSSLLQGSIKYPSGQVVTTADVTVDLGYAVCDYWTTGYAVSDCTSAVVPVTTAVDIPDPGDPLRSPFGAIMPPALYGFTVSSSQWPQLPFCVELAVIPPVTPLVSGLVSRAEPVARLALVKLEGIAWGSSAATGALAGAKRLSGIADAQAAPLATITRVSPYSD